MSRRRVALVLCLLLRATIGLPVAAGSVETGATTTDRLATDSVPSTDADDLACPQPTGVEAAADAPRIPELYPNPTNRGNVGEYLVLDVPPETALENLTITDGHTVAQLPNETADGRLAVTAAPEETRELTDDPIVELAGTLRLAVDGDDLEQTAADEGLPLEARLVDDTDEFEKIHAKGIVVDRETAVVGSANWNDNSLQHNREVLLAVHSPDAAAYYAAVFDSDWEGQRWSLPIELSAAVVVALLFAALVGARYVRFGTE
jgi:hypothetical protein